MRSKQFGVFGLFFALLLGARAGNRSDHPGPPPAASGQPESGRVRSGTSSSDLKKPTSTHNPSDAKDCHETKATRKSRNAHWWLSPPKANECSETLSPAWNEICKINTKLRGDHEWLTPDLTDEQFITQCLGDSRPVTVMMASIPNPQRTHLGLMTDRAIEAIQVAASDANFLPLSHYLPWPSPPENANGQPVALEAETGPGTADPGVLVFRNIETPSKLRGKYLLIFLIPETPTDGLDRKVFSSAETIMEKVSPGLNRIRLVGPNFSGSVASLRDLNVGLGPTKCIDAVSGSVTNFEKDPNPKQENCVSASGAAQPSTFAVVQTNDRDALCWFVQGAKAFGYASTQIAILSEEGTQYGRQTPCTPDKPGKSGKPDTPDTPKTSDKTDTMGQLWFLHFPREISKLRNAYGAETGKAAPPDSTQQTGLGLQWQDAEPAQHDDLQTYGGRQTPLSQETVLSSLSITLRAQGIKALGVLATDPMDEAFLVHSISESSPDVRLFLRDPDMLLLRTPDVGSLNGTLLVSNYPLIPQNQFWSATRDEGDPNPGQDQPGIDAAAREQSKDQRQRRLTTFPSAFQEGEYNAFVELIETAQWAPLDKKMKRLEWDWPAGVLSSKNPDDFPKTRPLWLATIGTAGHYPIKILNFRDADKTAKNALDLHSLDVGRAQFLPMACWAAVALLGIVHMAGLKSMKALPSHFRHDFDLSDRSSTVTLVKISCHMMALLTIALAQFILGSSYLFFYRSSGAYASLAGGVLVVTAVLLWAAARQFHLLYVLHKQQEQLAVPDERSKIVSPGRIFRSSLVAMAIMIVAGFFWAWTTVPDRFDYAFLHFRNLNLSSGVAPTLPLASVLMVLYFGVWAYLRRLSYWQHRYVAMCELKLDPVVRRDLTMDVAAIDACLLGPLENKKWMTGFWLTFFACILAFRPWVTLDMIEPYKVWIFVLSFLGLVLLTIWLNWFRFINIWVHLHSILEHLENVPLRAAFGRLPREKSLPILQWSSTPEIFLLRQVLDRLRALAHKDPSQENEALRMQFESRMDALMRSGVVETQLVKYRRVAGGSPISTLRPILRSPQDLLCDARSEMTSLTQILSARLLEGYWRRGSSGTKKDEELQPADLKYVLAEDIIALPFYAYVRKVVSELRNILFFLGLAISLLFAALHTYAFRADQAIDWWFFGLFAFMGTGVTLVIAQMERNALLSRLSDRTPGELGTGFYLQLLKYGTVPFLTIFGSQIPSVSNIVLKWVQPALEALH